MTDVPPLLFPGRVRSGAYQMRGDEVVGKQDNLTRLGDNRCNYNRYRRSLQQN